jgi:CBS domain-containing protein
MLVQQILKSKADEGVVTVPPGTSLQEAAKILSDKRIGTVVISSDGSTPDGILSERDIVRELGIHGAGCLARLVDDVMTKKLITCTLEATADSVLSTMTERRFRHMPVMKDGKMVGIVTLGDVVKSRLNELSMEKDALEGMIMGY